MGERFTPLGYKPAPQAQKDLVTEQDAGRRLKLEETDNLTG